MNGRLRQQIALEAARLLFTGQEMEPGRARHRAALRLCRGRVRSRLLPSGREIRQELGFLERQEAGNAEHAGRWRLQLATLSLLRTLRRLAPRAEDAVLAAEVDDRTCLRVLLEPGSLPAAARLLEDAGIEHHVERESLRVEGPYHFRLLTDPEGDGSGFRPSWIVPMELELELGRECPWLNLGDAHHDDSEIDQYWLYRSLLEPLAEVKLDPREHPEREALFHSLQVFDLTCRESPYDAELLLAALLHLVGYPQDRVGHAGAALEVLDGAITPRTASFIELLPDACIHIRGELTGRSRKRLLAHPELEDLLLLARCDLRGRVVGADVPDLDEALAYLQELTALQSPPSPGTGLE
jgi:hypothetical protein